MRATPAQGRDWLERRGISPLVLAAYLLVVAGFVWAFGQFHLPGKGFSYLISFGSELEGDRVSQLRELDYYVEKSSGGYDAQYYVQIAMDPTLRDVQLARAVDNLAYRARRILLPAVAYVAGLGRPAAILQAYALINAVAWLGLAAVLLHWFPPRSWADFARWLGVLASFGVWVSARNALTDGPSLLLIALGLMLLERGRARWAVACLGLGGLAKETNLLAASAFAPADWRERRGWVDAVWRGVVVGLPLALWIGYIAVRLDGAAYPGERNFDYPFVAFFRRWREVAAELPGASFSVVGPGSSFLMLVALSVQLAFLAARPRWSEAWWRVGASFAVLMLCLGDAVWEGYPGAASRVLLPMQLAFNVLVPRGRGWWVVLALGNLTLLSTPAVLRGPLNGGMELRVAPGWEANASGEGFRWEFGEGWHEQERGSDSYWSWTRGDAVVSLANPHPAVVGARLRCRLTADAPRAVEVFVNGRSVWRGSLAHRQQAVLDLPALAVTPGANRIEFKTDQPAARVGKDPRLLAFCVHDLSLEISPVETAVP